MVASAGPQLQQRIVDAGAPAKWAYAKDGTLSWVCGFALTSNAQNIPAAYALMNWQSSPEAQAIRAKDGYLVTNRKALDLVPKSYEKTSGVDYADEAIPETYPPIYRPDWIDAFKEFKAG